MSLYNMLHGTNKLNPILLKILDIDQKNEKWLSGRFRDIYLNEDGTEIILYTRNGGGNRECYEEDEENCRCQACIMEELPKHPNYLEDYDDSFDCTYAYIKFSIPEKYKKICKSLSTGEKPKNVSEKFFETIKKMEEGDKETLDKCEPMKKIFEEVIK